MTIKTIDNEIINVPDTFRKVNQGEYKERWVNCPTIIDEKEDLWVDESVLEK